MEWFGNNQMPNWAHEYMNTEMKSICKMIMIYGVRRNCIHLLLKKPHETSKYNKRDAKMYHLV